MKYCIRCKTEKSLDLFNRNKRSKDGFARYCKVCAYEFVDRYRRSNMEAARRQRKNERDRVNEFRRDYKSSRGCFFCPETTYVCLDLHHLDPSKKDINPSKAMSRDQFLEEASKCIVVCSNCHRKLHAGILHIETVGLENDNNSGIHVWFS